MPEYLSPGVYVEEIDAGPKPIAPVATSTAGVVGVTRRGPATPTLVTSYGDFVRTYGGPLDIPDEATRSSWDDRGRWWHAAESVKAFFDEGGARMFFQRVQPGGGRGVQPRPSTAGCSRSSRATSANDSRAITLSHVTTVDAGDTLRRGQRRGRLGARHRDRGRGRLPRPATVTLTAAAGVSARAGRDLAMIMRRSTPPCNVLTRRRRQRRQVGRRPAASGSCPCVGAAAAPGRDADQRRAGDAPRPRADAAAGATSLDGRCRWPAHWTPRRRCPSRHGRTARSCRRHRRRRRRGRR